MDQRDLVRRDLASGQSVRVALPEGKPRLVDAYVAGGVPVWIDLAKGEAREDNHIIRIAGGHVFSRRLLRAAQGPLTIALVAPKGTLVKVDAPLSGTASSQLAPMITGRELCAQLASMEETCIDLTTGAVGKRASPPDPYGVHDGVWWYAYAETGKMLVGPGENGPLHWQ